MSRNRRNRPTKIVATSPAAPVPPPPVPLAPPIPLDGAVYWRLKAYMTEHLAARQAAIAAADHSIALEQRVAAAMREAGLDAEKLYQFNDGDLQVRLQRG